ncbi:c6 zinc finger domain containing protein [Grosmannia clavigera kw1407]|uniref:C6 zinc finger domain containing protein n=1 Tax=Grosmannia clavigera (strain kw1407 / UAMH 11150) TaxID=655863 RepID=F0X6Q6_GROCL|nr:c6 zinc finger domain containing protein [Grosmannia clavigera kw1407]EFX06493.1 c6 zinc finger domain containing protein [Grosmannia clavigera kw1407]
MTSLTQPPLPAPKQIRFVNNQGQPPSKRRRINAACLTCRKRKTRCAGERPACSTCEKNGHKCLGYPDLVEKKDSASSEDGASSHVHPTSGPRTAFQERSTEGTVKQEEPEFAEDEARSNRRVDIDTNRDFVDRDDGEGDLAHRLRDATIGTTEPSYLQRDPVLSLATPTSRPGTGSSAADRRPATQTHKWHQQNERRRRSNYRRSVSLNDDSSEPSNHSPAQQHKHHTESHRVPYFRYFGPTAIVPGYKQMVVDVSIRDRRQSRGGSFSVSSSNSPLIGGVRNNFPSRPDMVFDSVDELPVYDPHDSEPVHPLIMTLLKTFFVHLGCNFPFLKERRILRAVSEKRLQPILVDAMCALAARVSDPLLTITNDDGEIMSCSEYGNAFSQRAKAAAVDTFPCPTIGAVQAFILMAYEGFGADQDSTLWMYLGIAIRMAVDLGLQKIVGIQYQTGTDPLYTRDSAFEHGSGNEGHGDTDEGGGRHLATEDHTDGQENGSFRLEELRAIEQERADTFWTLFFADRVTSSGTGRPVTFRDDDLELAFPEPTLDPASNWPAPFPTLVQIIHIYGRVSDVLNNIRNAEDLTQDKMRKLAEMEADLTQLYQKQDPRLNFNAANFQQYVRDGQGTNFILLHFWFHALIIILHQPTLLAPFGGFPRDHQLLANSHVLSMSSAKTIADILAFAELIDPKSFIGNPFTSQPMYIAACAFLMESAANVTFPASREYVSPSADDLLPETEQRDRSSGRDPGAAKFTTSSKHALLASNANQNYQRCYKSLQQMQTYWGGVRYILTALDQKAKGIWDCETYTSEEYESIKTPPRHSALRELATLENSNSPSVPPIAWSLTGTSNSSSPSLTLLFQSHANINGLPHSPRDHRQELQKMQNDLENERQGHSRHQSHHRHPQQQLPQPPQQQPPHQSLHSVPVTSSPGNMRYDPIRQSLPEIPAIFTPAYSQATESAVRYSAHPSPRHKHPRARSSLPSLSDMPTTAQYKFSQGRSCDFLAEKYGQQSDAHIYDSNAHHRQQENHGRQHSREDSHLQGTYNSMQGREMEQPQLQSYRPEPVTAGPYTSPPSHTVSPFEPPALCGTSPATSSLTDSGQNAGNGAYMNQATDEARLYRQDSIGDCLAGSSFPYITGGGNTNIVTFNSQEIDIGSVSLPDEMPQEWLAYLPGDIANLFDGNVHDLVE